MATMDQFLKKALDEGTLVGDKTDKADEAAINKAFADNIKRNKIEGGPGRYEVFIKMDMNFIADSLDDAMAKASDFLNKAEKQNRKLGVIGQIDAVDGPM